MAGLKPGDPNPGGFKKGFDPRRRPGGRLSEERKAQITKMQQNAEVAAKYLLDLIGDDSQATGMRLKAAIFVWEQAHGKAVDRLAINQITQTTGLEGDASVSLGDLHAKLAPVIDINPDDQ